MENNHKQTEHIVDTNKTITAVEWLVQQFPIRMQNYIQKDLEIANQMEREKIIKAYGDGWKNGSLKKSPSFGYDYYIKTYNK